MGHFRQFDLLFAAQKRFLVGQICGSIFPTSGCFVRYRTTKEGGSTSRGENKLSICRGVEIRHFLRDPMAISSLWAGRIIFSGAREIHYKPISATAEERREEAEEEGGMDGLVGE